MTLPKAFLLAIALCAGTATSFAEPVALPPITVIKTVEVKHGTTLADTLMNAGLDAKDVYPLLNKVNKFTSLRRLPSGQRVTLQYTEVAERQPGPIEELKFHTKSDKTIVATLASSGGYAVSAADRVLETRQLVATGHINGSLYASAEKAGLPQALVPSFANIFNWELDFTRDIQAGAPFKVVFDAVYDEQGDFVRYGTIHAAQVYARGKDRNAFRYQTSPGIYSYYDEDGNAKKRMLIRTPLNFTRISSHFNPKRKHPVLGYTKAHRGTDFAAPTGTPVWAAGDGVVEEAKWWGAYGRYVRIDHGNGYKSAYAHLNKFARGLKKGQRVRQGQTIAYVGTTGRSTGPHLHYEVLINNERVNALAVKLPGGRPLPQSKKSDFLRVAQAYQSQWNQADIQLASAN
jgi:murein DD-endopeptidase MepM/ murein hydrolase activator NlpD